ncbi:LptA/OstA family protein [Natroniella acetigena]|uniref:LptA/OstA family protein n=1 Tax=Natroniella acetigena TaxID=52004 RepID=UPI00200B031A|nr:LptA/OstA family protein [Natroniella acetigena]MCK8827317.1 LptA/OstA family protein [Natroniella acetigena]
MNKYLTGIIITVVLCLMVTAVIAGEQTEIELRADELIIDDLEGEVIATGNVSFREGELSLTTQKLTANQDLEQIEAAGEVVFKQQQQRMSGDYLIYNNQSQQGRLEGDPRVEADGLLITAEQFEFDLAAEQFTATGQVYLEDQEEDFVAYAERLEFYQQREQVILSGNVKAERGEQKMDAQEIVFDLATRKMEAKGETRLILPGRQRGDN